MNRYFSLAALVLIIVCIIGCHDLNDYITRNHSDDRTLMDKKAPVFWLSVAAFVLVLDIVFGVINNA